MTNRRLRPLITLLVSLATVVVALASCAEGGPESTNATQQPTDMTAEVALPSGNDALTAAAGQPHVVWFWGAH